MGFEETRVMEGFVELAGSVSVAQHLEAWDQQPQFP